MTQEDMESRAVQGKGRLIGLKEAAKYCGISYWTLRELVLAGRLPAVRLPAPKNDGALRRILLDVVDLENFINRCKEVGVTV